MKEQPQKSKSDFTLRNGICFSVCYAVKILFISKKWLKTDFTHILGYKICFLLQEYSF